MLITVNRFVSDGNATLSLIFINGKFSCFGLEDEFRETKVAGETRIPAGTYKVGVREFGGFHQRYVSKFSFHKGMLEILDVPGFTDILIHIGNTGKDTAGCLLVGVDATSLPYNMSVGRSTVAYTTLYREVIDAALDGRLEIEMVDGDRNG